MKPLLFFKLLANYFRFFWRCLVKDKIKRGNKRIVYFNFENFMNERICAHLAYAFHDNNYIIYCHNHPSFFANLYEYNDYLSGLPSVRIGRPSPDRCHVCITDHYSGGKGFRSVAVINADVLSSEAKNNPDQFLAFPMIPRLYFEELHLRIESLRNTKRNVRLFFSGNTDPNQYDHPIFSQYFKKLSRVTIIHEIKNTLADQCNFISDYSSLYSQNLTDRILLAEWTRKSLTEKSIIGRTSNEEWFHVLAHCDFFLACPGFIQPMCHNLIESMSVGVIPVLEHPEYLNPPLQDGVNCIVFSGSVNLVERIREVMAFSPERIQAMRLQVIEYYEAHLSLKSVADWVKKSAESNKTMYVITSNYFQKNQERLINSQ